MVAFLGTALALLNFGIDEFINPRLRAAGLTRRRAKKAQRLRAAQALRARPHPGGPAHRPAAAAPQAPAMADRTREAGS